MEKYLQVGVFASTHGVKGEIKVFPTTDDVNRFDDLKEVILDTGKEKMELTVTGVKYFKKFVILKFKEIDDINQIEKYRGKPLLVTRENAVPLAENEYFIADLLGFAVIDEDGKKLGTLTDVMQTGANDVYVVEMEDKKELLIPVIKQCVLKIDTEAEEIRVHLLEGLL